MKVYKKVLFYLFIYISIFLSIIPNSNNKIFPISYESFRRVATLPSPILNYFADTFFQGNTEAALEAIEKEAKDTNRSVDDILNALPSGFTPVTEGHDVVISGGGTGSQAMAAGISQVSHDITVGMVPGIFDTGGDSKNIQDALSELGTWIFSIGDSITMLLGLTNPVKKEVLAWRIKPDADLKSKTLRGVMEERIQQVYQNHAGELPKDWLYFTSSILKLASTYDEAVLKPGILNLYNASIKNRIFLAQLIKSGYLEINQEQKMAFIHQDNLEKAFSDFAIVLGIKGGFVLPASNDRGDLIAYYTNTLTGSPHIVTGQSDITEGHRKNYKMTLLSFVGPASRGGNESVSPATTSWPSVSDNSIKMYETAKGCIIVGPGSTATSLIPNLLLRGSDGGKNAVQAFMDRQDIPRILILNPCYTNETRNHSVRSLIQLYQDSIAHALGVPGVKMFGEGGIFSHVLVATPESMGEKFHDFNDVGNHGIVTTSEGAKVARGLLFASKDDVRYLESLGAEVIPIGEYMHIEEIEMRIIERDEQGRQVTDFVEEPTIKYDMSKLFKEVIQPLMP